MVCLFVCAGCGQSEACMELFRRHQLRCRAPSPYARPGSGVSAGGQRGIRCAGSGIQQIVHPAPTGLNRARPIVTWAITPAGASANVPQVAGKTPAPGSIQGSCAALTWQEELDMADGPSGDMMDTEMGLRRGPAGDSEEGAPTVCHMTNEVVRRILWHAPDSEEYAELLVELAQRPSESAHAHKTWDLTDPTVAGKLVPTSAVEHQAPVSNWAGTSFCICVCAYLCGAHEYVMLVC